MISAFKRLRGSVWLEHLKNRHGLCISDINREFCITPDGDLSGLPYKWRAGVVSPSPQMAEKISRKYPGSLEVYRYPVFCLLGRRVNKFLLSEAVSWLEAYQARCTSDDYIYAGVCLIGLRQKKAEYVYILKDIRLSDFVKNNALFSITVSMVFFRYAESIPSLKGRREELSELVRWLMPVIRENHDFNPHYELFCEAAKQIQI